MPEVMFFLNDDKFILYGKNDMVFIDEPTSSDKNDIFFRRIERHELFYTQTIGP